MSLNDEVNEDPNAGMAEEQSLVVFRNKEQQPEERQSERQKDFDITATILDTSEIALRITVNLENPLREGEISYGIYVICH